MSTTNTMYFYIVTQIGKGKNGKKRREEGREEGGKSCFKLPSNSDYSSAVTNLFGDYKFDLLKQPKGI